MKIQLDTGSSSRNFIRSYGPGQVTVNQQVFRRSLIVTPERIFADWPPRDVTTLVAEHFTLIRELAPEVVVLGTGGRLRFPRPPEVRLLAEANIGLEAMDTGAACRTYNILMQDGRRVLAALLMIEGDAVQPGPAE